jgi:hypothetical protein
MHRSKKPAVLLSLLAGVLTMPHCSKKDDAVQIAPSAGSLSPSTAPSTTTTWRYLIDPKSGTHVDMPGLNEHIKGDTTVAAGTLDIVPRSLAQSRGLIRVDLSTFATHTFGNGDDATQTKHALTWLEVQTGDNVNAPMRYAEFAIRSIDDLNATDVTTVAATKQGQDYVRTVSMTVHGELLVHGHKVQEDAAVDVAFRYPAEGNADTEPTEIEIKSRQPMRVVLKEHDVRPRDPAGQLLAWTTKLVSKVAETADVSVDLRAKPGQ